MSNNFGEIIFGAGAAALTPYATNGPTNPTPLTLPIMQELSIDITGDVAELYGADQFSYGQARTKVKIDCKAKISAIYSNLVGNLFFGVTFTTGQTLFVLQESQTVTSHTCTVTNTGTFLADKGVVNAATGQPYTNVGSGSLTAAGQYKVATGGVYTFYTSDTIATALITYTYSGAAGESATVTNKPMGANPTFDFTYMNNQFGKNLYLEFYLSMMKKFSFPNKNTDFQMPDLEFTCFSQTSGSVFLISLDE